MRIMLTGMTSQQTNPQSHRKSINFAGLLWESLRHEGHEVYWQDPSVEMSCFDYRRFDHVIVGVSPISALGANRAYGALSAIECLWDKPKLNLLIDAPDPIKMQTSFRAIVDNPDNLTKEFFSYRKEYRLAIVPSTTERLVNAVKLLDSERWPNTIVPRLPWQSDTSIMNQLPRGAARIKPLNLDSLILDKYMNLEPREREARWSYEKNSMPRWLGRQNVSLPAQELPSTFRVETNTETVRQLSTAIGFLAWPSKSGTWWSPKIPMAVSQMTPVFQDWKETQWLGRGWTSLPGSFEQLSPAAQRTLAEDQYESYSAAVPSSEDAIEQIYDALGSTRVYNRKGA